MITCSDCGSSYEIEDVLESSLSPCCNAPLQVDEYEYEPTDPYDPFD